ncbi:phenol hydroxylase [Natronococcus amylolyticus DSM 10524]|uniref:Phenol hydroxylase n=1 Tax=Natronococcus amylolyticus DSM 10524 TaxID=1227497 RepID=L9X896_9EURY|nr:FAD-dependent oxidoreductase [Natronococcus amylolyticus]ELY56858.1 phenol hydroxylase [Natronococcus amylolyticus DSM 10524]
MTLSVTVADVHRMTPDVKQFRLVADDHRFEFDPGQHTSVHFEADGEDQERPYTAINAPGTNQLVLTIKRYDDGTGSVYMHDRTPGDEIEIDPVDGNLHLRDPERDALFVATGTGITPLYPMIRQYADEGQGTATLVFGERDQEHLIFRESLDQLRAGTDAVSVEYVLSDADDDAAWNGRTGHVQDHLQESLEGLEDLANVDCYVCGVPEMVLETQDLLEDAGVDGDRVFTEGWEADAADDD